MLSEEGNRKICSPASLQAEHICSQFIITTCQIQMLQFQVPQKGISVLPNDRCVLPTPAGHKEHIADWVEQQMVLKEKESRSGAFKS